MKYVVWGLLLIAFAIPVTAQDETCDPTNYQSQVDSALNILLQALQNPQDDTWQTIANELDTTADAIRLSCGAEPQSQQNQTDAGVYTQDTNPGGLIGPIIFDGLFYRVNFEADGLSSVSLRQVEGDCGFFDLTIFDTGGGADDGIIESDECEGFIEVDIFGASNWTLTIEKIR